jgi:hypothetical protein
LVVDIFHHCGRIGGWRGPSGESRRAKREKRQRESFHKREKEMNFER